MRLLAARRATARAVRYLADTRSVLAGRTAVESAKRHATSLVGKAIGGESDLAGAPRINRGRRFDSSA